jgi:hypothetical protein
VIPVTTYWLRNTRGYVIDYSVLRDVSKQPLVWHPAGESQSWRCLDTETVSHGLVQHLLITKQVVPDPAYDAEASRRDPAEIAAIYAKAFVLTAPAAPAAAPVNEEAAKAAAEAEAAAKAAVEAEAAAKAEAEAKAAEEAAKAAAEAEATAKAEAEAKAAAEAAEPAVDAESTAEETPKSKARKGR